MTAIASTQADITRRNHDRAVRFFWTWLILATWLSLAGNVAHACLSTSAVAQWLAACVAAVPPTVLLLSVHALAVLAKTAASGAVYRAAVAATAVLAVGAFILSFVALRDLAVIAGIRPGLAPVLPLVIDLAIGVATLALVAIGDKPARRVRNAARGMASPATTTTTPNRATTTEKRALATTATRNGAPPAAASAASPSADDAARELAAELVAEKVTRHPIAVVEKIIAAHDAGDPPNRIAKNSGVHHSTVSRIVDAATARRQHSLAVA
ncbi:DUF2637 domain-containing protein [Mycolicibacterium farcinogenes]|uniref:DUF2637 domain-containing protein n=1 Tax=Mycolicibacterium farcinogenes TaxID=1802 RepID=A0ACD1FDG0_MYCFR|nr:DUF2637 domain-containing protein [Mycolicibacterium farcinogenes]QZH65040.1 DUF2637 domain-containing protein [Mycolicibacterium farcinogenes]